MKPTAGPHDRVTIHYSASTREGSVVEDTNPRKPLTLLLDDEHYLQSLRQQIVGMSPGELKTIALMPEQVFGQRNHRMQLTVPLAVLPPGIQEGDQLTADVEEGLIDAWVVHLTGDEAVLDTNHPLSGEALEYSIRLVSIDS